jgi:hypothetical protein
MAIVPTPTDLIYVFACKFDTFTVQANWTDFSTDSTGAKSSSIHDTILAHVQTQGNELHQIVLQIQGQ